MTAGQTSLTLNQIIETFETFASDHKQINSFYYGLVSDIHTFTDIKYVSLWCIPQPAQLKGNSLVLRFYFLFLDLVQKDLSNLQEIHSDTLTIGLDFVSYFKENYNIDINVNTITFFQDRHNDEVSGINIDANVTIASYNDMCSIPLE